MVFLWRGRSIADRILELGNPYGVGCRWLMRAFRAMIVRIS